MTSDVYVVPAQSSANRIWKASAHIVRSDGVHDAAYAKSAPRTAHSKTMHP